MNPQLLPLQTGHYLTGPSLAYRLLVLATALAYGAILASLPHEVIKDSANYLIYAEQSWEILHSNWSVSLLAALTNEPLWLLINSGLALFLDPGTILRVIIFVSASLVAWVVLQHLPRQFVWLLMFLFLPQVLKNHVVHLRQGVAIAVFLLGWFSLRTSWRWMLLLATPFIHASFFIVIALVALSKLAIRLRIGPDLRFLLFASAGMVFSLVLAWIATLLGARQANQYQFIAADVSGMGFLFWGMVLVVMLMQGRNYLRHFAFEVGVIIFYLATYFLIEFTARIFESSMLLVLLAGLHLTGKRRMIFIALVIMYGVLQYAMRIDLPWLGFGII